MSKLISIIIPAYNVEEYVAKTIESVLSQTYKNIELICVDDGSKDNTLSILKSLADEDDRIKVFSKANEGVSLARKYGFEQSHGELIGFVDADDFLEPDMYERLYNNLVKFDADISHCGYVIDNLDGSKEYFYNTGSIVQHDTTEGVEALILGYFEPGLCNKLYKRDLLISLFNGGKMDYSIKMNEDVLMNYYLFKEAKRSVLEDVCLYHYVKREGSATTSRFNKNNSWDKIKVKQIIKDDSIGLAFDNTAREAYVVKCINIYNVFLTNDKKVYHDDLNKIRILLKNCKSDFKLLSVKYRVLVDILLKAPKLYELLYRFFS